MNLFLSASFTQIREMETYLKLFQFSFYGINFTHTEISFDGRDFGFGRDGILVSPSNIDKTALGFSLKRVIYCGVTNVDPNNFDNFVRNSVIRYNRYSYHPFMRNCRMYSEYLLVELAPNRPEEGKIVN